MSLADNFPLLQDETPHEWLDAALSNIPTLLVDHANCERKAAVFAISMMDRYSDYPVLKQLSQLAREELCHYEKVLRLLCKRKIPMQRLSASRYAKSLRGQVEPQSKLNVVEQLIVCAFIEARSCERFEKIVPLLIKGDGELADFYAQLALAEKRHYLIYIEMATELMKEDITPLVSKISAFEHHLIYSLDEKFRFHSGIPSFH